MSFLQVATCVLEQFGERNLNQVISKLKLEVVSSKNLRVYREVQSKDFAIEAKSTFEYFQVEKIDRKKLDSLIEKIDLLRKSYLEIQTINDGPYFEKSFNVFSLPGLAKDLFLRMIVQGSLKFLEFPSQTLLSPNPDLEFLASKEAQRKKNMSLLNPTEQFYFKEAAFRYKNKIIYFSDLWKTFDAKSQGEFYKHSIGKGWIEQDVSVEIDDFKQFKTDDFVDFVIRCSIYVLEDHLTITFSQRLIDQFQKLFADESIRSDVLYFTSDGLTNISKYNVIERKSFQYIHSIKMFLDVVGTNLLNRIDRGYLFEMIFFHPFSDVNEGFLPNIKPVLDPFRQMHKNWEIGNYSYSLFSYFCNQESGVDLAKAFISFVEHPAFRVNCEIIYNFCKINSIQDFYLHYLAFREKYFSILLRLKNAGICVRNAEDLFLHSPLLISQNYEGIFDLMGQFIDHMKVGKVSDDRYIPILRELFLHPLILQGKISFEDISCRIKQFFSRIQKYNLSFLGEYVSMVKQFMLSPSIWMFDILDSAPLFHDKEVVLEAFSKEHTQVEFPNSNQQKAYECANIFMAKYKLSKVQTFLLYLEFLRSLSKENEKIMANVSEAIYKLEQFCPYLDKEIIFNVLYKSRLMNIKKFDELFEIRKLKCSSEFVSNIINELIIQLFGLNQLDDQLDVIFRQCLLAAFFAPMQPLDDYCKIKIACQSNQIEWVDRHCSTHLGQLKPVLKGAKLSVYLNWSQLSGKQILFISFYNEKENIARSTFIDVENKRREEIQDIYQDLFLETVNNQYFPASFSLNEISSQGHIFSKLNGKDKDVGILIPMSLQSSNQKYPFYEPDGSPEEIEILRTTILGTVAKNWNGLQFNGMGVYMQLSGSHEKDREILFAIEYIEGDVCCIHLKLWESQVPLQYSETILGSPSLFLNRFRLHNLYLKSSVYQYLKHSS